jgi:hypothetical protein
MMAGANTDAATLENIKKDLGLNKPLSQQFVLYMNDLSVISIYKDTPANQANYDYTPISKIGEDEVLVLKRPYLRRSFQNNRRLMKF